MFELIKMGNRISETFDGKMNNVFRDQKIWQTIWSIRSTCKVGVLKKRKLSKKLGCPPMRKFYLTRLYGSYCGK